MRGESELRAAQRARAAQLDAETHDLVARARAQAGPARDELLLRLRPGLLDRIEIMMGPAARNYAESHDIAQSVVVDVIRDLDRFKPGRPGSFLRWACQIARNHICDEVRRRHEQAFGSLTADSCEVHADHRGRTASTEASLGERRELVADALLELPDEYRTVVRLRYFEGLKFAAIAQHLGRSENAVNLLHSRALLRLGALLRDLDDSAAG